MNDNHNESRSASYAAAGVDVTAGYEAVNKIRPMVESTFIPGVLGGLGGFGGMFCPDISGMSEPVLVSGTDGVGTKLKLAFTLGRHSTIGIDAVAMCVNDIICTGAKPLFFLDYFATGGLDPDVAASVVSGVVEGCRQAGCALIGGETAEMPGFYPKGEYDLAGFAVGIVDKSKIIDGSKIKPGDVIIGVASSGCHSNGFSLIRKALGDDRASLGQSFSGGRTIGDELLTPTKIYVKPVLELIKSVEVLGISHMTGGGWYENIPRMLPKGIRASVSRSALPVPEIFGLIAQKGDVPQRDMYNTFNMGLGLAVCVAHADADKAVGVLTRAGERAAILGRVIECARPGVDIVD